MTEFNHRGQLAKARIPSASPALTLLGIIGVSIHSKALGITASTFLEEIAGIPSIAGVIGLLLVQLTFNKSNDKSTAYFAILISIFCIFLSFLAMLVLALPQSLSLPYLATVVIGLYLPISILASLQDEEQKKFKGYLSFIATVLILLGAILTLLANKSISLPDFLSGFSQHKLPL